MLPVLPSCSG